MTVEVRSYEGGQRVGGCRCCGSAGEVIQIGELSLSLQLRFRSMPLTGVPVTRSVAVAVAVVVAVAGRRAGPVRQMMT